MDDFNKENIEGFTSLIREIVYDVLKKTGYNNEKCYDGLVKEIKDDGTIVIDTGDNILTNLINRSGEPINEGDVVRVFAASPSLTDAYVGRKLN